MAEQSLPSMLRALFKQISATRKRQMLGVLALMLVGGLAEVVTIGAVLPVITLMADPARAFEFPALQQFFTTFGWSDPESIVLPTVLLFMGLVLFATVVRLSLLWASTRLTMALGYDLGVSLYGRVLDQPFAFHISKNSSEIIAATNKVQMLLSGVLLPLTQTVVAGVMSLAILVALLMVDIGTALVAGLGFGALYLGISRIVRARLKRNSRIIAEAQGQRVRCIQEGLGGIRDVILDGTQHHYVSQFARVDRRLRFAQATNSVIGQAPRYLIEGLGISLILALAFSLSFREGGLTAALPVLGALALGAQRLLPNLQALYNSWSRLMGNRQVLADVLDLMELPAPKFPSAGAQGSLPFERSIEFHNVSFSYRQGAPSVLHKLNLTIPKGSRTGFIGRTGSGKSTTVDILMGLLEPTEGELLIDGVQVEERNRALWRSKVAHVPQSIYLADATVAENIALGVPPKQIDQDRVREVAKLAQVAEFIEQHPQGYQAHVGERGVRLSGGQRQRIGIARALYKRAEVLVFDEATSALDQATESDLMRAIESIGQELTIIMIAHRLQTLRNCDQVVKLQDGRIVHVGSWQEVAGAA